MVLIELHDTNHELVDSLSITTNQFGSVQGEFKIPKNVLSGNFKISLDENFKVSSPHFNTYFKKTDKNIQVEEYKRPKFEVEFKPIDATYVLNDSIQLKGKANAFFGGNLTNAKVSYTVDRISNYNYRYYYPYANHSSERLTTGETTTDNKGNFKIKDTIYDGIAFWNLNPKP